MDRRHWKPLVWVACALLGGMACGPVGDGPPDSAAEERTGSEEGLSGIVLEPNTIRGRVRFTNQNPTILQMLDTETRLWGSVTATSTAPTGYSGSFFSPKQPNMRGFDFEMSVEAGAGGASGVTYTLAPRWYPSASFDFTHYQFQPVAGVKVLPRSLQPLPTEVDINECVGVIRFLWGKDAACTTPQPVEQVWFHGMLLVNHSPVSSLNYYVRGGSAGTSNLSYGVPVTNGFNRFNRTVSYNLACDQVVTVCTQVPSAGELGAFQGPWQVEGEDSIYMWLLQLNGPGYRYAFRQAPPLIAPASDPSTWWKLSELPPGTYGELSTTGLIRQGRDYTYFRASAQSQIQVVAGQTSSLLSGGNYPFVMRPAYIDGALRLVDPSVPRRPGAYSSLQGLFFEGDHDSNHDGFPDNMYYDPSGGRYSSILDATVDAHRFSRTSFRGAFDPAGGELASGYEHVLPVAWNQPASWTQSYLRLGFWTQGGTFITRPGQYDPRRYRYGYLDLTQKQRTSLLAPGQRARVDHEYCFNEVQVEYSTQGAPFYNPTATVTGSYQGLDWRGKAADYTVSGQHWGTPAAVGLPETEARGYAQQSGSVSFALPQGSYTLTPGATLVNSDGTTSSANFQPTQLSLGCGQKLKLVPPLAVSLDAQPECAPGAAITLSGRVRSGSSTVDRVWYRLNGGPEVTVCTNCGLDPVFQFPVALAECGNTVQVYAYSEGMPEPATTTQDLVWDDPVDGPSCTGATCVTRSNQPPVARCRDVEVAADAQCLGSASVDDGSSDPDPGDTVSCVPSASGPFPPGSHPVTLTCTDAAGLSSSCQATVTVRDTTPPELTCPASVDLVCVADATELHSAPASAHDNCGGASVTCLPASGEALPAGSHAVSCSAVDGAGNSATCTLPFTVPDVCPTTLRVTLVNLTDYDHTQQTSLRLWGYVASRTTGVRVDAVWFSVNGVLIPVVPRSSDGFVEATVSLQEGSNRIQLLARDSRGDLMGSPAQEVFVDHQPPTVTVLSPGDDAPIGARSAEVHVKVEDESLPVLVTTPSGFREEVWDAEHVVSIPLTFTTRGYYTLTVTARDDARNSTQRPLRLWVDYEPPKVTPFVSDGAAIPPAPGDLFTFTVDVASLSATTTTVSNLPGQQFSLPRNGGRFQVRMPLQPGANTFNLQTTSETGLTTTITRTLHYGASP